MTDRTSVTGIDVVSPTVKEEIISERIEEETQSLQTDNNNNYAGGNVRAMQDYKDEADKVRYDSYADMYDHLLAMGKSPSDALQVCKHLQSKEGDYFKVVEDEQIQIGLRFPVSWLEKHFGFSKLEMNDKTELMWSLGMDVKGKKKWHTRTERARDLDGKDNEAVLQQVVYGSERLDDAYVGLRYPNGRKVASEEAQDWRRNRNGGTLRV